VIPARSDDAGAHAPPPPLDVPPPLPESHTPPPLPTSPAPIHAPDPWAHRRGEPRLFALGWTIYVLIAVVGSIMWVARFASVSAGSYGPAARIMLVVVSLGATLLWPMVRLSQASPRGSVISHVLADVFIILMPIQFVLWPLMVLANWPLVIVAGVAAMIAAWVVLAGGLLALGLTGTPVREIGDPRLVSRAAWMGAMVVLVMLGPVSMLMLGMMKRTAPAWWPMVSPITGIPAMTGVGLSGPQSPISMGQWESIGVVAGVGLALWVVAGIRSAVGGRNRAA
jgi:hypothetical protein